MSDTHEVLNLRQVEAFVAAAEAGSMTAAAERLQVSQSAVSLAVAGLERTLGTALFLRHRGRGGRRATCWPTPTRCFHRPTRSAAA